MDRIVGIAVLMGALLLARPEVLWADSTQAALAVSVVVPAGCAVQVPGILAPTKLSAVGTPEGVVMRCTKGTLPAAQGSATVSGAVAPQITRSLILPAEIAASAAPRPLSETSPLAAAGTGGAGAVITVNF